MRIDEPITPASVASRSAVRPHLEDTPPADFDYRELLHDLLIVPWESDRESFCFTYVGPQAQAFLGYPRQDWYRKNFWADTLHPEDREAAIQFCLNETNEGRDHSFEYRMINADGQVVWVLDIVRVHRVGTNTVLRGLLLDITKRKLVEEAARQSEARLNACVQHTPHVAIQWFDRDGRIVFWNTASERMFGYTSEEAIGKTLDQLILTPEATPHVLKLLDDISRTGKAIGPAEYTINRRDGSEVVCLATIFGIPSPTGEPWFVCMDVDITDRKRMESQIRQAQKAESLGVLAGGVAHDFNNLLTAILGFASLAEMDLPADSPVRESIRQVISAGQRAAELTQQMLAYAGKGKFLVQPLHLSWVVKEMARLMQSGVSKKTRIEMSLSEDLPLIEGDAVQLRQVIMSLVTNGSEALLDREGEVQIRTGVTEVDEARLAASASTEAKPGMYVFVEIIDTGRGMDAETTARIFDPFFSTKFTGRGLGLAAALGIVRSHHGLMEVHSQPGKGSTFRALFPAIAPETSPPPAPKVAAPHWRGSGNVLIVDDEAPIRTLCQMSLSTVGFQVDEAGDGHEAVRLFRADPQRYVAILLDLIMPRMDGSEVLQEVRALNRTVPVILISGYTQDQVASLMERGEVSAFLHKPFTGMKLIETLRDVLGVTK